MSWSKWKLDEFESVGYYLAKHGLDLKSALWRWQTNSIDYQNSGRPGRAQALLAFKRGFKSGKGKANPMANNFPKGKFVPVEAVRLNANGTVTVKVKDSVVRRNPAMRRNISEGFMAGGVFHPIRHAGDYDPSRAGEKKRKPAKKAKKKTVKAKKAVKRAAPKKKAKKTAKRRR